MAAARQFEQPTNAGMSGLNFLSHDSTQWVSDEPGVCQAIRPCRSTPTRQNDA